MAAAPAEGAQVSKKALIAQRLVEAQISQTEKSGGRVFGQMELDELGAIVKLAYELFGPRGMVEAEPAQPGIVWIGQYDREYPKTWPIVRRKRALVLRGGSHRELLAQAKLVKYNLDELMRAKSRGALA